MLLLYKWKKAQMFAFTLVLISHGKSKKFIIWSPFAACANNVGVKSHRRTLVMYECENEKERIIAAKKLIEGDWKTLGCLGVGGEF